jgi:putative SOS response-associated peptidase YedK
MCGFVSYNDTSFRESPNWVAPLTSPLGSLLLQWPTYSAYPAFGGDTNKRIPLLVCEDNSLKIVQAVWWFDAICENYHTTLGRRTSFNARNLDSPFWKSALNHSRGLVLAGELGESKLVGKTKHQYLMQSQTPFMLGAIYRKLNNGDYCCAIITRDAHPKMAPYHDKAFPLFLPTDDIFLNIWLGPNTAQHPQIDPLLRSPKLYPTLRVQRVKTYKHKQTVGSINDTLYSDIGEQA